MLADLDTLKIIQNCKTIYPRPSTCVSDENCEMYDELSCTHHLHAVRLELAQ